MFLFLATKSLNFKIVVNLTKGSLQDALCWFCSRSGKTSKAVLRQWNQFHWRINELNQLMFPVQYYKDRALDFCTNINVERNLNSNLSPAVVVYGKAGSNEISYKRIIYIRELFNFPKSNCSSIQFHFILQALSNILIISYIYDNLTASVRLPILVKMRLKTGRYHLAQTNQ